MANYNCYVRIYLPLNETGKPNFQSFGHYDLQIDSADGKTTFPFDSHTPFKKPVISYGGTNGAGYIKIFDAENAASIIPGDCLLCKYHFTASKTKLSNFVSWLKTMVSYDSSRSNNQCAIYEVVSGDFTIYNKERNNAFGATAAFANKLGCSTLVGIYNSEMAVLDYMTYAAWKLYDQMYEKWQHCELNK